MFTIAKRTLKILDFDTECRPMHYNEWRPESQITAIAWSWVGEVVIHYRVLGEGRENERQMLQDFLEAYDEADLVTGHYIRKHDLPLLNDHAMRLLGGPVSAKLTQDTMQDLREIKSLGKSQDNLAVTLGLAEEKHHMTGADWREANTLDPTGKLATIKRVTSDVAQHKALHARLLAMGVLHSPRVWSP